MLSNIYTLMAEDEAFFFSFFYISVSVSFRAACDFDGHLIAASISFRVGHSHRSLKELFLWLSQKPHSSSNETSGVLLSSDMKEDGRCHCLTCLRDHQAWRRPINVHIYIYISSHRLHLSFPSNSNQPLLSVRQMLSSSNYMLQHWDADEECLRP